MFSSMEYLLCGLPVVTTPNVVGRNWFFSNDCVVFCEDTAEAVAEAVERLKREAIPPHFVRENALERIKRERLAFFALIDRAFRESGQESRRFEAEFERIFVDKINYIGRQTGDFLVP